MQALGIDLGGTKIAGQIFDQTWSVTDARRVPTPQDYDALINAVVDLCHWADTQTGQPVPVGIGAAGLMHPKTGLLTAANHVANGKPLQAHLMQALGRPLTLINDGQAMGLSEAILGAGRGHDVVLSLVIGTGVSASVIENGILRQGYSHTLGEVGHIAAPAHLVMAHKLPLLPCKCGSAGCIETLLGGAGITRIDVVTNDQHRRPEVLIAARANDPGARRVWDIWCALAADLLRTLTRTVDPDCIVLGGGLSQVPGVADDLAKAAQDAQFDGFDIAPIFCATGGDATGAKGAAYAAVQAMGHTDG